MIREREGANPKFVFLHPEGDVRLPLKTAASAVPQASSPVRSGTRMPSRRVGRGCPLALWDADAVALFRVKRPLQAGGRERSAPPADSRALQGCRYYRWRRFMMEQGAQEADLEQQILAAFPQPSQEEAGDLNVLFAELSGSKESIRALRVWILEHAECIVWICHRMFARFKAVEDFNSNQPPAPSTSPLPIRPAMRPSCRLCS